jgi:hypothetical protein
MATIASSLPFIEEASSDTSSSSNITPQSQSNSYNEHDFLDDIDSSAKRVLLAFHKTQTNVIKQQIRRKATREERFLQSFHQSEREQQTSQQEHSARVSDTKNNTDGQHSAFSQFSDQTIISLFHMEPNILRLSIYEKFLIHYQHFYNEQIPSELLTKVMLPCCNPSVVRQNKLWAKVQLSSLPSTNTNGGKRGQPSSIFVTMQAESYLGLDSFVPMCNKVLEVVPDSMLIYKEPSIIKKIPNMGTIVKTPFVYFGTYCVPNSVENQPKKGRIPSLSSSSSSSRISSSNIGSCSSFCAEGIKVVEQSKNDSLLDGNNVSSCKNDENKVKYLRVELHGWNNLQFDENDRLIWRVDNFLVHPLHDNLYDVSPDALWDFVWKRRKTNILESR